MMITEVYCNYWFIITALKVDILLHKGTNQTLKLFDKQLLKQLEFTESKTVYTVFEILEVMPLV